MTNCTKCKKVRAAGRKTFAAAKGRIVRFVKAKPKEAQHGAR